MSKNTKKYVWIAVAAIAYIVIAMFLPTPAGLEIAGKKAIALMVAAVILWVTEAVPVGYVSIALAMITGILGISPLGDTMKNFFSTTIIFMISSQLIAKAFVETGCGRRVALKISFMFGDTPSKVLLAFMLATGVISMFLVDIPCAIIFGGIAYGILQDCDCQPGKSKFGMSMMIGIPIAAAIGGFATPVGSGLNQLTINMLNNATGIMINFAQWSIVGVPMAIILLFLSWIIISKVLPAEIDKVAGAENVKEEQAKLGALTSDEKKFIVLFAIVVFFWVTNPITHLDNNMVAALGACVMSLAGIEVLKPEHLGNGVGWHGIMLVAGATAVAMCLTSTGASKWIADMLQGVLGGMGAFGVIVIVVLFAQFIHFLIPTGGALVSVMVPIMAAVAQGIGMSPVILALIIGYTVSNCFLMPLDPIPLATYGYGYWKMGDMTKYGLIVTIVWSILLVIFMVAANGMGIYPVA